MRLGLLAARRARTLDALAATVTAGQVAMARNSIDATADMLAEQGVRSDPMAELDARLLAGVASDGRPLRSLLEQIETEAQFDLIVRTQLQDVGRTAEAVARAVEPQVTHYVRVLSLPSCGRCVVLAGIPQRSATAFDRHPRCDCISAPTTRAVAEKLVTDPREAFARMTQSDREKAFTKAGAEAISLGADPGQVVNARRENAVFPAQVFGRRALATREGVTRRGVAGSAMRAAGVRGPRLMPESILALAEDKADAVRLLKRYGFVL